jgi:hypothetical protein
MFKVSSLAVFWRDVEFTERVSKSEEQAFSFKVCFKRLPVDVLAERTASGGTETVDEFIADVVTDWDDIACEDGPPLPFTAENFKSLLSVPGMSLHLFNLYLREVSALRTKN